MAAAMCNHATKALSVDYGLQRRAAGSNPMRRRFPGLPRVKSVSSLNSASPDFAFLLPLLLKEICTHGSEQCSSDSIDIF